METWKLAVGMLITAINALFIVIHGGILFFFRRELSRLDRHAKYNHDINDNFLTLHSRQTLVEMHLKLEVGPRPIPLGDRGEKEN